MTTLNLSTSGLGGLSFSLESLAPQRATGADSADSSQQLRESCGKFEAVFMNTLLREMRKTVSDTGGVLPESQGGRMMRELLDERVADQLAQRGALGIAAALERALTRPAAAERPAAPTTSGKLEVQA